MTTIDYVKLRQYCIDHGLNYGEELRKQLTSPRDAYKKSQQSVSSPPVQLATPSTKPEKLTAIVSPAPVSIRPAEDLVVETLDQLRNSKSLPQIYLKQVVELFNAKNPQLDTSCSPTGFVSGVIYQYALKTSSAKTFNSPEELKQALGMPFSEDSLKHILGILPDEYIMTHYPLNTDPEFKYPAFVTTKGSDYSIEGTKMWSTESKRLVRALFLEKVQDLIRGFHNAQETQKTLIDTKIADMTRQTKTVSKEHLTFEFLFNQKGGFFTFSNSYLRDHVSKDVSLMKKYNERYTVTKNSSERKIIFTFKDVETRDTMLAHWNAYVLKDRLSYASKVKVSPADNHKNEKTIDRLQSAIDNLKLERQELLNQKLHASYLGLEGVTFGSYLGLHALCAQEKTPLDSIIFEYDKRSANIMQSIIRANPQQALCNVHVYNRNIDDAILLDFPSHDLFSLSKSDDEWLVKYTNDNSTSTAPLMTLSLYQSLIDAKSRRQTDSHLAREYRVSQGFLDVLSRRDTRQFNIVFLDYVGGLNDMEKKKLVLDSLFKRRLTDNAIIGITINTSPYINRVVSAADIPDLSKEFLESIIHTHNYTIVEKPVIEPYANPKSSMLFMCYHVKKTNAPPTH